jgi:GTP-binding protein Era
MILTHAGPTKCGFVSILGRPNVGKSTLLNALMKEKLALVSHKANATRKRMQAITVYKNAQIIFVDTPGIHKKEKLLNKFMLEEAIKAIGDCDISMFVADVHDDLKHYEEFLELNKKTPHILVLNKIDNATHAELISKIKEYSLFQDSFLELVSVSALNQNTLITLFEAIKKHLPESVFLYDEDLLTTETTADIYKEFIREAIFNGISDEIPYESDVVITKFKESNKVVNIMANIVVEKTSQKGIIIGKGGATIKRIGSNARVVIERFSEKKCFLELFVKVQKGWSKNRKNLLEFGYEY